MTIVDLKRLQMPLALLHIEKTAGTAFVNYLMETLGDPAKVAPPFMGDISLTRDPTAHYELFWGHYNFHALQMAARPFYILTFLRDPMARVISQWKSWANPKNLTENWISVMTTEQIEAVRLAQTLDFEGFVFSNNPFIETKIRDLQTRYLADIPDMPNMIASAKRNLAEKIAYFGIVERFEDSMILFGHQFRGAHPYSVASHNENRSTQSTPMLSEATRSRIYQLNSNDYELYGYAMNLFEQRFRHVSKR